MKPWLVLTFGALGGLYLLSRRKRPSVGGFTVQVAQGSGRGPAFFRDPGGGVGIWDYAIRTWVFYPRQTIRSNAPQFRDDAADSVTRWQPEGTYAPKPLATHTLPATANFYGTDPLLFGPPMAVGPCAWAPTAFKIAAIQNYYGPMGQPMMPNASFAPSTTYNPYPSFGTLTAKLP